ncbi:hypothetical protein QJQ45_013484 [Haematococcus lacustris]|nr:hypothetical protein QJQ45_013484 [Haematococcus lacustris]
MSASPYPSLSSAPLLLAKAPVMALPEHLLKPPTGESMFDVLPILSMVACIPTIMLFFRKKRYLDAIHMGAHQGMDVVTFAGFTGAAWRTVDIVFANLLLARTLGHVLGVSHPLIACEMGIAMMSKMTCGCMVMTLVAQLLAEGRAVALHVAERYTRAGVCRALVSIAAGLFSFYMPTLRPQAYWLWHSLWHVFMGVGYWELYRQIEGLAVKAPGSTRLKVD